MCRCKSYGSQWRCGSSLSEPTSQPAAGYHDAPQCEQPRVRRNTRRIPWLEAPVRAFSVLLSSTSDRRTHLCFLKKLIFKMMPSYLFQSDKWCQWGRLHAHSRSSLCLRHEEKLARRHHAGPTKPLGTQTVSIKEELHTTFLFVLYI